ncbi:MAG: hypothetical protein ACYCPT_09120 [Acidimicrobiales bacterium]
MGTLIAILLLIILIDIVIFSGFYYLLTFKETPLQINTAAAACPINTQYNQGFCWENCNPGQTDMGAMCFVQGNPQFSYIPRPMPTSTKCKGITAANQCLENCEHGFTYDYATNNCIQEASIVEKNVYI